MSNDGGIQYWQQAGVQEEYEAWLDGIESEKAIAQPVKSESENQHENASNEIL